MKNKRKSFKIRVLNKRTSVFTMDRQMLTFIDPGDKRQLKYGTDFTFDPQTQMITFKEELLSKGGRPSPERVVPVVSDNTFHPAYVPVNPLG